MSEIITEEQDPKQTLNSIISTLPNLELTLEALLNDNNVKQKQNNESSIWSIWSENLNKLDNLDRAKMDILISYTINDLIWVYLKLKGIDPEKHDVTSELDRIKTYYTKVKSIEKPETQRTRIDSAAAHRFVKSSIPKSQHLPPPPSPSTSAAQLAKDQAQKAIDEQEEDESIRRLNKSNRFRFIEKEGKESIIPGEQQEQAQEEEGDDIEDEDHDMDQDEIPGNDIDADAFLKGVEEEMNIQ
ncbi:uncharacterized protein L201_004353 [Kwoniella dendrophila CBS 6074]|uniref:Exosome complex protein n=1 Tax=Kwoniella dendrophila CBS 6074 TaxID=1295534 RepID=A0AAX4JVW2_9TREE